MVNNLKDGICGLSFSAVVQYIQTDLEAQELQRLFSNIKDDKKRWNM